MNHEVHVVNKIFQQHLGVERNLAAVDGAYSLGNLVHRFGLRQLCDAAENNISPVPVFPPLAYPNTFPLLDAAFLKPSTHEISFHASTVLIMGSAASVPPSPFASFARFHASKELRRMSFLRPSEIVGSGFTAATRL